MKPDSEIWSFDEEHFLQDLRRFVDRYRNGAAVSTVTIPQELVDQARRFGPEVDLVLQKLKDNKTL